MSTSLRSSWRCNCAHTRSQCVPLNNTCKKDFGLHLLKTTLFLVSHIAQHNDAANTHANTHENPVACTIWATPRYLVRRYGERERVHVCVLKS